jgi:hypothetical protein
MEAARIEPASAAPRFLIPTTFTAGATSHQERGDSTRRRYKRARRRFSDFAGLAFLTEGGNASAPGEPWRARLIQSARRLDQLVSPTGAGEGRSGECNDSARPRPSLTRRRSLLDPADLLPVRRYAVRAWTCRSAQRSSSWLRGRSFRLRPVPGGPAAATRRTPAGPKRG